ncbi:MAG: class II glutamine amidotransferase [Planctomycetaceae bacterium]
MCRLYGFRANEETKVECSLVQAQNALILQSESDEIGRMHPDGWGISVYNKRVPDVERRATAAYQDLHFSHTAERIFAKTVVAHVRRATVGGISLNNTHPFTYDCWTFAHNGTLSGFDRLQSRIVDETDPELQELQQGTTDSEHIFYWLLTRLKEHGFALSLDVSDEIAVGQVVADAVQTLANWSGEFAAADPPKLNLVLTNGVVFVATRWNNSLHWVARENIHDCELCGIPHIRHRGGITYRAVVVASERISQEEWNELPNRSVLMVGEKLQPRIQPIKSLRRESSRGHSKKRSTVTSKNGFGK